MKKLMYVIAFVLVGLCCSNAGISRAEELPEALPGKAIQDKPLENFMEDAKDTPVSGYRVEKTSVRRKKAGNISYRLEDGVLTISGTGAMPDYSKDNRPAWEKEGASITSVTIEEGVTSIGEMAFYKCTALEEVSIPATVSSIGKMAFAECTALKEAAVPDAVTVLPYAVFANCRVMKTVTCKNITAIEDYAFQEVPLSDFVIPKTVTSLSPLAFFRAQILSYQMEQGNRMYTVEDGILYSNQGKTLMSYPSAKQDTAFTVPSHVTEIGDLAMSYTICLNSVTIGNSVKKLGESAFQGAYLTSVAIPDSVTAVGNFTFFGCPQLTSVTFGRGLKATSYQMFRECISLREIHFGTVLQTLDAHTFAYCTSLTDVELPATVKTVGVGCFGECHALKSFRSGALSNIPYSCFWNCYALQTVVCNQGVTDIYRAAFYNCRNLKAVTLPASVKFVHSIAFPKTTVLTCKNASVKKYGTNGYRYIQSVSITGDRDYTMAFEVLKLVNAERAKRGLGALTMNASLMESAMARAAETAILFSHTRPDGSICFDINAAMYAENIAAGNKTAQAVMASWMNSEGHRANILLKDAGSIGIGCFVHNGMVYWVQCFGKEADKANCAKPANRKMTQNIALATESFGEAETGVNITFSFGSLTEYSYKFNVRFGKSSMEAGAATTAKLYLKNPGFTNVEALLNNTGVTWKSSNRSVAKVNAAGKVTAVKAGTATITAALKYFSAGRKMTVAKKLVLKKGKVKKVKKIKHKAIKVICKKQKKVTGYQVRLSANKKMKKAKVRKAKKRRVTFKNLKQGKKYYIQVRVYKKVSGKRVYGKWGKKKKVKL